MLVVIPTSLSHRLCSAKGFYTSSARIVGSPVTSLGKLLGGRKTLNPLTFHMEMSWACLSPEQFKINEQSLFILMRHLMWKLIAPMARSQVICCVAACRKMAQLCPLLWSSLGVHRAGGSLPYPQSIFSELECNGCFAN